MDALIMFLLALTAVCVLIPFGIHIAHRYDHIDHPDRDGGRKDHEHPTPQIGGLVLWPISFFLMAIYGLSSEFLWPFMAGALIILVTGAIDDRYHLHAVLRLCIQIFAASLPVIWGNIFVHDLGNLFGIGIVELGMVSIPFSILAIVLMINAMNMIDGLDGLAGGIGIIILASMAGAAWWSGWGLPLIALSPVLGALAGFLVYNMRYAGHERATVFMGDAGSMVLGYVIGVFAIMMAFGSRPVLEPISTAWLLSVPVFDCFWLIMKRLSEGRHPFSADRHHLHHHLMDSKYSVTKAVFVMLMLTALYCLIGVASTYSHLPAYVFTWVWMGCFLVYVVGMFTGRATHS